ncbi:MAG: choice-of-anchor L domain-containing protein [Bacteroidetes bacterium]|nr:choice-of-anchor L domain-containing protein [Bacteroidota bacterium]
MKPKLLFTLALIVTAVMAFGQSMTVNTSIYTAEDLVQEVLINGCVTADNVTNIGNYSGSNAAIGYFNASGSGFPFSSGVILSTGLASAAPGSGGTFASTDLGLSGDNDLDDLLSGWWDSQDAVILEFDFVPSSDTIQFRYIFGSEEYPEYVNSSYNDVFGFFITGPNPQGGNYNSQNIALIPGTTQYVSIDNVNNGTSNSGPCMNCAYYINNSSGSITVYDGLTTPLTAFAEVVQCETYHIKLAIADAGDHIYDSGVFIEAGSFSSGGQVSMNNPDPVYGNNNDLYEGCDNFYVFSRLDSSDTSIPITVNLNIIPGPGVVMGTDISNFPTSFTIPIGEIYDTIYYSAFVDYLTEGTEYIIIQLLSGCPCSMNEVNDTIFIYDDIPFKASLITMDVKYCDGNYPSSLDLVARCQSHPPDFVTFTWSTTGTPELGNWNGTLSVTESIETVVPVPGVSTYWVTIADLCGNFHIDSVNIIVSDMMPPTITTQDDLNNGCTGEIHIIPNGGYPPYSFQWWENNNYELAYENQTDLTNLCDGMFQLVIYDNVNCSDTILIPIAHVESPQANFVANYTTVLEGTTVHFTDLSMYSPTSWSWQFDGGDPTTSSDQNPNIDYYDAGTYNVSLTVSNVYGNDTETKTGYIHVTQSTPPVADFTVSEDTILEGESVVFTDLSQNSPNSWDWDFPGGSPVGSSSGIPDIVTYYVAGVYDVSLTVVNVYGSDTETKTDYIVVESPVYPPVAGFSPYNEYVCVGSTVAFTDQSTNTPTSYAWTFENGNPASSTSANPTVSYYTTGTHDVLLTVTNSAGTNTKQSTITVTSPPQLTISTNATQCGSQTGSAVVSVSGGTSPIYIVWSNGATTPSVTGLPSGAISVTVTDGSDCVASAQGTVSDIGVDAIVEPTHVTCYGGSNGSATVDSCMGNPPFTFLWSTGATTTGITELTAGTYIVTVTDALGCIDAENVPINQPDSMEVNYIVVHPTLDTTLDGSIIITNVENASAPLSFAWNTGATGDTLSGVMAGNYTVTVTDGNGCTHTCSFMLNPTSIRDISFNSAISIYPNPSKGVFYIEFGNVAVQHVEVIDVLGKTIRDIKKTKSCMDIDLSGHPDGVYFIRFYERNGTYSYRITKQH